MDKEKVIKGLDCCAKWMAEGDCEACDICPYHPGYSDFDHNCIGKLNNDALALLKEQEPVVPQKHYNNKADLLYACGKCRNDLKPNNRNAKFCWFCGQAVKWQ